MPTFKILFVDDEPQIHELYRPRLEEAGYEIKSCTSPQEAKAIIAKDIKSFNLAVIDLKLVDVPNDTTGLNVAAAVDGVIPVIILTRELNLPAVLRAIHSGLITTAVHKSEGVDGLLDVIKLNVTHRVFVAHGHDTNLRADVVVCLKALGIEPLVLASGPGKSLTIPELIEEHSNVSFAVILLTPDDVGGERAEPLSLKPRARQNVILEWGFFTGRLGRDRVAVLHKEDHEPIELPSNYGGLRSIPVDGAGKWRTRLAHELHEAGLPVNVKVVQP